MKRIFLLTFIPYLANHSFGGFVNDLVGDALTFRTGEENNQLPKYLFTDKEMQIDFV